LRSCGFLNGINNQGGRHCTAAQRDGGNSLEDRTLNRYRIAGAAGSAASSSVLAPALVKSDCGHDVIAILDGFLLVEFAGGMAPRGESDEINLCRERPVTVAAQAGGLGTPRWLRRS
jgi:hypothetical protein